MKYAKEKKELKDFKPIYNCRFHPFNWWHEVGCPHKAWGVQDLQNALNLAKQSNAYLTSLLTSQREEGRKEVIKEFAKIMEIGYKELERKLKNYKNLSTPKEGGKKDFKPRTRGVG